ncbi:hypothetical protein BGX29_002366 [Mortierella sp. GBA35]|nr:hypothetical protein BGX29_002366 [Mortierella sp. GBA35]
MVAISPNRLGLVLSLYLSSALFLSSTTTAQVVPTTGTLNPTATGPAVPGNTTAPAPGPVIDAPKAFFGVASASNKKMIYYQGGQLNAATVTFTTDFYSLDLTKSWPISTPAWTNLTKPTSGTVTGPQVGSHSAAMSADGGSVLVTAPSGDGTKPFLYQYNIAAGTWSTVNAPAAQAESWANRKKTSLVTVPATGTTWLLGGSSAVDGTSTNQIDSFKSGEWTAAVTLTPAAGVASSLNQFSSGTAELHNNKIFIFGGFSSTVGQRGYQSFQNLPYIDVSTNPPTYGIQSTLGKFPQPRQDHCTVKTDSKKVLVFGGYDANAKASLADLWSLDLVTMTWTQILATNPTSARHAHTCNIAGANMVVFGGMAAATATTPQAGYGKDIQVYDVMLSKWMSQYAPKQDDTAVSEPLDGSGSSKSGLTTGALIGIIAGAVVVLGVVIGLFIYKRRQKQIEIREAEMEKEAYLASLRPENGDAAGRDSKTSPGMSPSAARALGSTPGMAHSGAYAGMDELLLNNAAGSPGMGGQGQENVQYLMQHLPDGTIAVQPVYLDHGGALPMQQHSPNMQATNSPSPLDQGYISPPMANHTMAGSSGGYFAPPPPSGGIISPGLATASTVASPYMLPHTSQKPMVSYPHPAASQDPFASPLLGNAPMPPGYNPPSNVSGSAVGGPQQMHPEQM